jgi:hypothetical protein
VNDTFARAKEASLALAETRERVRDKALAAMRAVESSLVGALGGERLRGLPNVAQAGASAPFYAARINAFSRRAGSGKDLPIDGREVLVLLPEGCIAVAHWCGDEGAVGTRAPRDEELLAEDLEAFVRVVQEVLERHVIKASERTARLERLERMAEKLKEAIGLEIR